MLCVVGGGKMGAAIVGGLIANGYAEITVVETDDSLRTELANRLRGTVASGPVLADGAIIAVKPKDALDAVSKAARAGAGRILSIAAGITLDDLQIAAGSEVPVLRAMPNIGALASKSATALCWAGSAGPDDVEWASGVLSALGTVVDVEEGQMDAVTGLSGSGPAYVFLVAEALMAAGVTAGLTEDVARQLVTATLQGSAELLNHRPAAELRQMVTTPGGTTAAGLQKLEEHGLHDAFVDAVRAASQRSHELGTVSNGSVAKH